MESLYRLSNPVFSNFIFYATVVVLKMMAMSFVTGYYRMTKRVFPNREDRHKAGDKLAFDDQDVERARRCHMNDIENIIPFLVIGLLYVSTAPSPGMALLHFRIFAISRLLHMFMYMGGVQPARSICFIVGLIVTVSMAFQVLTVAIF